jgi:hypothetical protein
MINYVYTLEGFKTTSDSQKIGNLNVSTDKSFKVRNNTNIVTSYNKKKEPFENSIMFNGYDENNTFASFDNTFDNTFEPFKGTKGARGTKGNKGKKNRSGDDNDDEDNQNSKPKKVKKIKDTGKAKHKRVDASYLKDYKEEFKNDKFVYMLLPKSKDNLPIQILLPKQKF